MPKRPALDDEWNMHKEVILDLYIDKGRPLSEVIAIMAAQGFKRTKPQFERAFKLWGVSKNISKAEWTYIVAALCEREGLRKSTDVKVRGVLVPRSKIRKQRRLYEIHSVFGRISSQNVPIQHQPPSGTVVLFTPAASPCPCTESDVSKHHGNSDHTSPSPSPSPSSSPWKRFQYQLPSFPTTNLGVPMVTHDPWDPYVLRRPQAASKLHTYSLSRSTDSLLQRSGLNQGPRPSALDLDIHPVLHDPASYLPTIGSESTEVGSEIMMGLREEMSGIDLLQLVIATMSNNFEVHRMASIVLDLTESPEYLLALEDALRQQLDTTNALAEKLLHPAVHRGRMDLVALLLNVGVDVNLRVSAIDGPHLKTALECAVDQNNLDSVNMLVGWGATDWDASFWSHSFHHETRCQGTVFDLAIHKGYSNLFEGLLRLTSSHPGRFPEATLCMLCNAVLLGRTDIVKTICRHRPQLLEAAKFTPWILFEAAVLCEQKEDIVEHMVNTLCRLKLDITAMSATGSGSALAAASKTPNMAMIWRLIASRAPTHSVAIGTGRLCANSTCSCQGYEERIRGICDVNALYVAIDNGHSALVRLLLSHGADPHQACGVFPIQLAAARGNLETISLLVQAGVDVNATCYSGVRHTNSPNSEVPALRTALMKRHIKAAELIHSAGGTLFIDDIEMEDEPLLHTLLPFITANGSRDFVLEILERWSQNGAVAREYIRMLRETFGSNIIDLFCTTQVEATAHEAQSHPHSGTQLYETLANRILELPLPDLDLPASNMTTIELFGAAYLSPKYLARLLILATRRRSDGVVKELCRSGADAFWIISLSTKTKLTKLDVKFGLTSGESGFRQSVAHRAWNITQIMLTKGCVRPKQIQMCEAFAVALCGGHSSLEQMLLAQGIKWTDVDRNLGPSYLETHLQTVLKASIQSQDYGETARILDYNHYCKSLVEPPRRLEGKTLLQYLALQNQSELVRKFLDLDADVNAAAGDIQGATAFQFAAMNGNFKIADVLIKAGANINAPPALVGGRTAIEGAAEWGRLDMVHYLLESGADIDDQRNYRRTIYRAWKQGHRTIARMVYKYKAGTRGNDECETPESIMRTMTKAELHGNTVPVTGS